MCSVLYGISYLNLILFITSLKKLTTSWSTPSCECALVCAPLIYHFPRERYQVPYRTYSLKDNGVRVVVEAVISIRYLIFHRQSADCARHVVP